MYDNILPVDGEALFFPEFFSAAESDHYLETLTADIQWKQEPIVIAGREIMQPRLTAWYGDAGKAYRYSGVTMHPHPWTSPLIAIREKIEPLAEQAFTSALLNLYRNGQDSMGFHRDNEKELGPFPVIGSVSFGATRTFHFRHYRDKSLKRTIPLTHGSFLLMRGATQHHWLHGIPKEPAVTGSRINITFRTIIFPYS